MDKLDIQQHVEGSDDKDPLYQVDKIDSDTTDDSNIDEVSVDEHDTFEDDISTLRSYSFITISADGASFEMHSLVQLATRKWLDAYRQREKWNQCFLRKLEAEFPMGYEGWVISQRLFPHTKSAAAQKPEGQESLLRWASLLHKAARYAVETGNRADGENMSFQALKVHKRYLGLNIFIH